MADDLTQMPPEVAAAMVRKLDAEAAKLAAEARGAASDAEAASIELDREQMKRRKELAANDYHHVFLFSTGVTESSANSCIGKLTEWMRLEPGCDVEIVFNSPGGEVIAGLALFDFIQEVRRAGHKVTTAALGYAASMAGILLQAGDVRVMAKESWLLIHETQFNATGSFGDVEDRVKWVERIQNRILDIFADRSHMTKRQLKTKWHRKDWWIDSDESLKLGLVDEVR